MTTASASEKDKGDRIFAALSYIPLLFLIPLLSRMNSDFAQFHAKQGFILFIAWFLVWIVSLLPIVWFVAIIGYVVIMVVAIIALVRTLMGQRWEIPLVAPFAKKLKF